MLECFETFDLFETETNVEQLEKGIYLEHISASHGFVPDMEIPEVVFGEIRPDCVWWQGCIEEAVKEGFIGMDGLVVWNELGQYFSRKGFVTDYMDGVSLETLSEMLDEGEKVICVLNDFVLEMPQAASLPGISPNQFVWVAGLDLSEPGRETIVIVKPVWERQGGSCTEQWPLENFLKAWMTGNNRALSVCVEG